MMSYSFFFIFLSIVQGKQNRNLNLAKTFRAFRVFSALSLLARTSSYNLLASLSDSEIKNTEENYTSCGDTDALFRSRKQALELFLFPVNILKIREKLKIGYNNRTIFPTTSLIISTQRT